MTKLLLVMKRFHLWWRSLRAPLLGQMDVKHCTRLGLGNSILHGSFFLRLLQFSGRKIFAEVIFLMKIDCIHPFNVSSQMWRARMRKSKSRSFNPSSPLFLDRWKGKSDRRTSKYFDSIRILIWHVGKHAWSAMLRKHSLRLSVKRTKGRIFNFRHLLFKREVLNGSKTTSTLKKASKLKGFPKKSWVFGSIWNWKKNLSKGN